MSGIPNYIHEENVTIAPRQGKKAVSILTDEFSKEEIFAYLLLNLAIMFLKISQYVLPGTLIKRCWTLISNLHQMEATYFLPIVHEKHHLVSLRNFIMHKIKTGTLTTGAIKKKLEGLWQVTIRFHLWAQSKEHQHTGNSFYMMYYL